MSENTTEDQTIEVSPSPTDIKANLKEIFNRKDLDTYAHGTRIEIAKEIINKGLRSKGPDLSSTAVPLFNRGRTFEEQIDGVLVRLKEWPHLESKAIIIIMLPVSQNTPEKTANKPEDGVIQIKGLEGQSRTAKFLQEIQDTQEPYELSHILPPGYIKGFVDVDKNEFISNPKFNPLPIDQIPKKKIPERTQSNSNPSEIVSPPDLLP